MATEKKGKKKLVLESELEQLQRAKRLVEDGLRCTICGKTKLGDGNFYRSTSPYNRIGYEPICKECIRKIACPTDDDGNEQPSKETVMLACKLLNKPFIQSLFDSSIQESENENGSMLHTNVWTAYIKNVSSLSQYSGLTWEQSDHLEGRPSDPLFKADRPADKKVEKMLEEHKGQDTYDSFLKNKEDVIRLIDYDPFDKELVEDQPFLYSQLVGMLDNAEESNEDMFRTNSAISIARSFLQAQKIDDSIAKLSTSPKEIEKNAATIKSLQETKKNTLESARKLAEESCLTMKNSKDRKAGSSTWTGKLAILKDLQLRDAQVNGFDIMTCRGMQQVQEIADESIMKQLRLDESDWSDIVAQQRERVVELQNALDQYKEINRILLQENLDLKDYCEENDLLVNIELKNLKELYSPFSDLNTGEDDGEEVDSDEEFVFGDESSI